VPASTCLAALVLVGGCGLINPPGSGGPGGGGGGGGGATGFGQPTLEVTVGGMHYGPAAPDPGSGVDLSTARDQAGQITSSSLTITASSTAANASCSLGFQRFGQNLAPFRGGGAVYRLSAASLDNTPDGVVAPAASEFVDAQSLVLQCSGSACDGSGLLLTTLAPDHVEGTFNGTLTDNAGRGAAEVFCSFFLPTRSFNP